MGKRIYQLSQICCRTILKGTRFLENFYNKQMKSKQNIMKDYLDKGDKSKSMDYWDVLTWKIMPRINFFQRQSKKLESILS